MAGGWGEALTNGMAGMPTYHHTKRLWYVNERCGSPGVRPQHLAACSEAQVNVGGRHPRCDPTQPLTGAISTKRQPTLAGRAGWQRCKAGDGDGCGTHMMGGGGRVAPMNSAGPDAINPNACAQLPAGRCDMQQPARASGCLLKHGLILPASSCAQVDETRLPGHKHAHTLLTHTAVRSTGDTGVTPASGTHWCTEHQVVGGTGHQGTLVELQGMRRV